MVKLILSMAKTAGYSKNTNLVEQYYFAVDVLCSRNDMSLMNIYIIYMIQILEGPRLMASTREMSSQPITTGFCLSHSHMCAIKY